ncbi:MAG: sulfatase [Chloroflexi bacterium]|nr:sulfatase [Chloroflexota bacterium]
MRILYIDIDSQRPDHLGCYGYHRNTSPAIDSIAAEGVRFTNCYATDVPCLPSRTSLFSGRFGIHTGVINHGGAAADPFVEGSGRQFRSTLGRTSWMSCLRQTGLSTATVSPFGERHSAWHWYTAFNEIMNTGKGGLERADEIAPVAIDWLRRNAARDQWFLHVNVWDPHTPYRTPEEFGNPFRDAPIPQWLTEDVRQSHWNGVGPHSAQEVTGYAPPPTSRFPRQPGQISSMDEVRRVFDGYDTGVRYADTHIAQLLDVLREQGVLDETVIIVSADHGECLGELNIYGDHQTADELTTHVPLIIRWPGVTDSQCGRVDTAFHYQFDMAATVIDLLGGMVPAVWDGVSFATAFREGREEGRDHLVLSQGAWACQRSVRFDHYILMHSYHDGHHGFPGIMLFDLDTDPHEQHNLAGGRPDLVARGMALIEEWHCDAMRTATHAVDPMWTVLREGGPFHTRRQLPQYLERLRATGREAWAEQLARQHPSEV